MFLILLSFFAAECATINNFDSSRFHAELNDTSAIYIIKPDTLKEKRIFSDKQLHYKQELKDNSATITSFLESLTERLFSRTDSIAVKRTRQLIIWSIVIISVLVVIRLLRRSSISGLTRATPKSTVFSFNDITEDLHSINYKERISEAVKQKDYRLAIRWHYLELLFQLDKQHLIHFEPQKTNIDYRYELKDKETQQGFYEVSRIYDYVWYGQFVLNESNYNDKLQTFITLRTHLHV